MNEKLRQDAAKAATVIKEIDQPILVISHFDCDGISSAVVAHEMLDRAGKEFTNRFVDELNEEKLADAIEDWEHDVFLFTDIGSGQAETIDAMLGDSTVVIADHHEPQDASIDFTAHVNPHFCGVDGEQDISGAGVTYLVAEALDEDNRDLLPYAILGATGDIQKEGDEYLGLNKEFVAEAKEHDLITVKEGLKLYGRHSKNLVTALKYTTDPYLDGISNDESGTIHFLNSIDIPVHHDDGEWRSLSELSAEEEKKLIHGLITRGYDNVQDLIGTVYIMDNDWEMGEFSSLLNACGRLEQPEAGLDICLEDDFELAWDLKKRYGRKIGRYLGFVERNKDNDAVIQDIGNGTVIKADGKINPHMIGTITTICAKANKLDGPVLLGLAEKEDEYVKISGRVLDDRAEEFQINEILEEACAAVDGEGGGHSKAAGGKIPRENQERFINVVKDVLQEHR